MGPDLKPGSVDSVYHRVTAGCRTVNQLNRWRIELENRITPAERFSLASRLVGDPGYNAKRAKKRKRLWRNLISIARALRILSQHRAWKHERKASDFEWGAKLLERHELTGGGQAGFDYGRSHTRSGWVLYQNGSQTSKTVLVVWTGAFRRPMIPVADFLAGIEPIGWDVLILNGGRPSDYQSGVRGLGRDLSASVAAINRIIRLQGYTSVVAMGTSQGCGPAFLTARSIGAKRIFLMGPSSLSRIRQLSKAAPDLPMPSEGSLGSDELVVVYGSKSDRDQGSAAEFLSAYKAQLREVEGAPHAVLDPILQQGRLSIFMRELFEPADPRTATPGENVGNEKS